MKPTYLEKYPHVFEPMTVGKKIFKNRLCLAPMGGVSTGGGADSDGRINNYGIDFYTDQARSGFGAISLPMEIPRDGSHPGSFNLNEENLTYMNFHLLQRSVHAYNALTFVEVENAGPGTVKPGLPKLGADTYMVNGVQVRAMTEADMEEHIQMYVELAKLAVRANFDGMMLHFAHGWLIHQFLSPLTNHRTDKYGGSLENRCRFPLMIVKAIKEAVGDHLLLSLRLTGNDGIRKPIDGSWGITPEDAAQQVLILQDYVDMLHITEGTRLDATQRGQTGGSHFYPNGKNAKYSAIIKNTPGIKIPIGTVGGIHSAELAEQIIADGMADYVLMARPGYVDHEFVKKIREGREEDIRPCLRCNYCKDHGRRKALLSKKNELAMDKAVTFDRHCAVNPTACQGASKLRFPPAERVKNIAVIGGGIAGMQAAMSAADRGHQVILFEKTDRLGGQACLSDKMWFKKEMKQLHEYFERQVRKNENISVLMNTRATRELIEEMDPDAVIVAVGAEQIVPNIPGIEHAVMAFDALEEKVPIGKNVVIVGGGSVGCELSIHLGGKGHNVTVVEMSEYYAASAQLAERMDFLVFMEKNNVQLYLETKCIEIKENGIVVEDNNGTRTISADTVIVSAGTIACSEERDQFKNVAFDVINVGDCVIASDICNATETGWNAGAIL